MSVHNNLHYSPLEAEHFLITGTFSPEASSRMTIHAIDQLQKQHGGYLDVIAGPTGVEQMHLTVVAHGAESAWLQSRDLGTDIYRSTGILMGISST